MAYVRFQAPAVQEGENAVSVVSRQLSAAKVKFSGVKEDDTAPNQIVVRTKDADAVRATMGLKAS